MYHSSTVCSQNIWMVGFQVLATMNKAAVNIHMRVIDINLSLAFSRLFAQEHNC